jgi:hypothetical protein
MNAPLLPLLVRQLEKQVTMQIVVDKQYADLLRRTVILTVGEHVRSIAAQPVPHSNAMRFWFSLASGSMIDDVMTAVMHALPEAEFGRYAEC